MKGFKRRDLENIQNLGAEDRKTFISKIPSKMLIPFYLRYCSNVSLLELLNEWNDILENPGRGAVDSQEKTKKKLLLLLKGLKRKRLLNLVSKEVKDRYGF